MLLLHRVTIRPRHEDEWAALRPREVELRARHGFRSRAAFLETQAEPKLSWLYEHDDPAQGERDLAADPDWAQLREAQRSCLFGNLLVRPVRPEHSILAVEPDDARTVVMRRYSIVGDWAAFLDVWRGIVPLRERHGFRVLFAVADEEKDMFTWAFDYAGAWADFPDAQRGYYRDPERVALRGVFDFMADYTITPASVITP